MHGESTVGLFHGTQKLQQRLSEDSSIPQLDNDTIPVEMMGHELASGEVTC